MTASDRNPVRLIDFARVWRRPAGAYLALALIAFEVIASRLTGVDPDVALVGALGALWGLDNVSRTAERIGTARNVSDD